MIMLSNAANLLTLFRILLIPAIVGLFYTDAPLSYVTASFLFTLACITDYFDGVVARATKKVTTLGRFLDPLADKLLIAATIIMLVGFDRIQGIALIPTVVILCREILVSGLREYLSALQQTLPVTRLAKWKTGFQMVGLGVLILGDTFPFLPLETVGLYSLWVAAVLTVITGYNYLKTSIKHMR
jgi:CDP-diacylglycerol--glycerol-3-phosphate 3-phosphatidyltransferase (EC 2.7.8.5)